MRMTYMVRIISPIVLALLFLSCQHLAPMMQMTLPGRTANDSRVRLPNGWYLSPAGTQIDVGDTPLNMDIDPEGRMAVVTNNGAAAQSISIIDLQRGEVVQTIPLRAAWVGVKFYDGGKKFAASGGASNRIYLFACSQGAAALTDSIVIAPPWDTTKIWIGGIDIDETQGRLFACGRYTHQLFTIDLGTKSIIKTTELSGVPYTCLLSNGGKRLFVSVWGDSSIEVIDTGTLVVERTIATGSHPNDMVESPNGKRLFVANGNDNTVSVLDLDNDRVVEVLNSALYPGSPPGSTPNSVDLSPDGNTLYIANADNNCIAVMDVSRRDQSRSLGFIPTGWYPSCVRVDQTTGNLLVANAKGLASAPNPDGPTPGKTELPGQYIGKMFHGTVSIIDQAISLRTAEMTRRVYENSALKGAGGTFTTMPDTTPIPLKPGEKSPIKHVFYIMKENRTYDQVFGDVKGGNGDSTLAIFGEKTTPNLHALVNDFVLLDNVYCDAEVSADGHSWSMAAYASDYIEKSWPTQYGGFGGEWDYDAGNSISRPVNGYIWDNCIRSGVSWRDYGEQVKMGTTAAEPETAEVSSQLGNMDTLFRGWDLDYSDVDRVKEWTREFDAFEQNGNLPQLEIIDLPNDHTAGTKQGALTPWAMVAQNDQAVGMIVERISRSRYWKESAVFIIEDDAQSGPDHIDAHRTEALVISPYVRRHAVDHTMYSTTSLVRTMELILGLLPMSQFDASAMPMVNAFTVTPDTSSYALRPPQTDINEKNIAGMYGQDESGKMNFTEADAAPDIRLNEILWKSVRGARSTMPPPVRGAFVRVR